MHVVNPPKSMNHKNNSKGRNYSTNFYKKNNFYVKNNSSNGNNSNSYHHVHKLTCSYCNTKDHTPNANTCYIRNFGVPYGEFVSVKKGIDTQGPKSQWIPRKYY